MKGIYNYLSGSMFSFFLAFLFLISFVFIIFDNKIKGEYLMIMEFFLLMVFAVLIFASHNIWEMMSFVFYKKILFSSWWNKKMIFAFLYWIYIHFFLISFIFFFAMIDFITFLLTSKYILVEFSSVLISMPMLAVVISLISLSMALLVTPWSDLFFGLQNKNTSESGKSWSKKMFFISLLASFYMPLTFHMLNSNSVLKENLSFYLMIAFPISMSLAMTFSFSIWHYAYKKSFEDMLMPLIVSSMFSIFFMPLAMFLLNYTLPYNSNKFSNSASAMVHFFSTIFLPMPVWGMIVMTFSLFVISLLCIPWKEMVSSVSESLQSIAMKLKGS